MAFFETHQILQVTAVGPCFEELAEAEEFDVYEKFADEVLSPKSSQYLVSILARPEVTLFLLKINKNVL
jgi:hypothetical protein